MNTVAEREMCGEPAVFSGWRARLALEFQSSGTRTEIVRREHEGPLLIQRAFYPEGDVAHTYIIHPPGGIAGGDALELSVDLHEGSHALLTTPAANKFYRRGSAGKAVVSQAFRVKDSALEWLPQESIYYPHAAADVHSVVHLSGAARFIGWEMSCLGLPASGLTLGMGELRLGFELWKDGRPLLLDRLRLDAEASTARWGMSGYSTLGCAMMYPAVERDLQRAKGCLPANCAEALIACTLIDGVLVCRALAQRADHLKLAFVGLWRAMRPAILGREAVAPRIWST
jgi:urease accessory protein